jgi:hypothetical protein
MLLAMQSTQHTSRADALPEHLQPLAEMYPDYDRLRLEEAHADLYRYFDMVWEMFVRLDKEGKLEEALTVARKFPKVKTTKVDPVN